MVDRQAPVARALSRGERRPPTTPAPVSRPECGQLVASGGIPVQAILAALDATEAVHS
jgi:hypothetical protein